MDSKSGRGLPHSKIDRRRWRNCMTINKLRFTYLEAVWRPLREERTNLINSLRRSGTVPSSHSERRSRDCDVIAEPTYELAYFGKLSSHCVRK